MDFLPRQNKPMLPLGGLDDKSNSIDSIAWDCALDLGCSTDVVLKTRDWSFSGPFGTFDKTAMQRGFQVYNEVCAGTIL